MRLNMALCKILLSLSGFGVGALALAELDRAARRAG